MGFLRAVIDSVLPPNCSVCGKFADGDERIPYEVPDNLHICFDCLTKLVPNPSSKRFFLCLSEPYNGDPYPSLGLYLLFPYDGFWERAIPKIKFESHSELALFGGIILGSFMLKDEIAADVIIPIPLSSKRLRERGYNQASLIAAKASEITGIPFIGDGLMRVRDTKRQADIKDNGVRANNIEGAFKVNSEFDYSGLTVIVLDDVATTGHTLHEAACEIYKAGAKKVMCVTLCGNRAVLNGEIY